MDREINLTVIVLKTRPPMSEVNESQQVATLTDTPDKIRGGHIGYPNIVTCDP